MRDKENPVGADTPVLTLPSCARFHEWRVERFSTPEDAAYALGLDVEMVRSLETGSDTAGQPVETKPWVAYMMRGYDRDRRRKIDRERAAALLEAGRSIAETAETLGVSTSAITYLQARGDLPRGSRNAKFAPKGIDRDAVVAALQRGESYVAISRAMGVSQANIAAFARKTGLRPPRSHNVIAEQKEMARVLREERRAAEAERQRLVLAAVRDGSSIAAAGRLHGYTPKQMQRLSKELGLGEIVKARDGKSTS